MSRRREHPIPKLPISLEDLPSPESKRSCRLMLSFTDSELAMIRKAARERGEQPAVLCRTIVLTALQNSPRERWPSSPIFSSRARRSARSACSKRSLPSRAKPSVDGADGSLWGVAAPSESA